MFKRIDHIEIIPRDFDRSIRFYTEVMGLTDAISRRFRDDSGDDERSYEA